MKKTQLDWIKKAYEIFAAEGPNGLRIERLSKEIGKNKSSFYYHFSDLETFTSILLDYHLSKAVIISDKESRASTKEELIHILLEHKIDLLFNRQLRINRDIAIYKNCFEKVNAFSIPAILPLWGNIVNLGDNSFLAQAVLNLSLENFFLQITEKTLNLEWLNNYFNHISSMINHLKSAK